MAKLHKFINEYFDNGRVKYHPGSHYQPNDETRVAVAAGHAVEVDAKPELAAAPFQKVPTPPAAPAPEAKPEKPAK